jgi:predicted phage terminase large subunit-like protein
MDLLTDFKSGLKQYIKDGDKSPHRKRAEKTKAAQNNFYAFCRLVAPDFYKDGRDYQKTLCDTLQSMYEKKLINPETKKPYTVLIINLPPGFGKSYTACLFAVWVFGKSIKNQVITVSYMQDLAVGFSKNVRNNIAEEPIVGESDYYTASCVFPHLKIKQGDAAMDNWSLEGHYMNYLGTSFSGKLTGMRGNIVIVDDPIRDAATAANENEKKRQWDFYKNTFTSRKTEGALEIIIQTRWATDDLAGMLETKFPERCRTIKFPALDENGRSLCENLYSTYDLLEKQRTLDEHIWSANFMQVPVDIKGALYGGEGGSPFKTYQAVDDTLFERVIAYIDTADEGRDYLCAVIGGVIGRHGYILDVYYTDAAMETTEGETARRLHLAKVREALIESNSGGRGFARNVERLLKEQGDKRCNITWFHQSKNKKTRIIVNATNVLEQIIFPEDWEKRFSEFAKALMKYQRKGKNEHDDAPDALTGFVEFINGDVKGRQKARLGKVSSIGRGI